MKLRFVFIIIIIFMFGQGCSVYMAANQPDKKDVSVFNVGTPRTHVIAEAGSPRYTKENADGTLTDTFVFVQGYSSGSKAGRALFHGAADFLTLGLWEVIGTPVEDADTILQNQPLRTGLQRRIFRHGSPRRHCYPR